MLYKFEVYWTQVMKGGVLDGLSVDQSLEFPTEKEVKRYLAYLLTQDNCDNIGIRLNKEACLSDLNKD